MGIAAVAERAIQLAKKHDDEVLVHYRYRTLIIGPESSKDCIVRGEIAHGGADPEPAAPSELDF